MRTFQFRVSSFKDDLSANSRFAAFAIRLLVLTLCLGVFSASTAAQSSGKVMRRTTSSKPAPAPAPAETIISIGDDVPAPLAGPTYEYIGSFRVSNGPYWAASPPCYTAREAAALIFGGQPTDYAISVSSNTTDPSTITHTAFLDGYGTTMFLSSNPQSEDFKVGTNYQPGSFSALVHDHNLHGQGSTNYVWRVVGYTPTAVSASNVLISEFRLNGPQGSHDEYVELYNNSGSQIVVSESAGSGWALRSSDGVTRFIVPAGTIIPARGHYLGYGEPDYSSNRYSLQNYGGTGRAIGNVNYQTDIGPGVGIALFNSTTTFDASTLIDSVGFAGVSNALYFEGTPLSPSGGFTSTNEYAFVRKMFSGAPQDTNDNAADFMVVSTTGAIGVTQVNLGAPGPEALSSPISNNSQFGVALLDPLQTSASAPNRARSMATDPANCATFGTMTVRRTFINNTGAAVTRLRFRAVNLTTFPAPSAQTADLRLRTIGDSNVLITGGSTVLVRGTTLETPPNQPACGGLNSSLNVSSVTTTAPATLRSLPGSKDVSVGLPTTSDVIDLDAPLANGASINVQFLFGVQQTGRYRFLVNIEALP
jgi:hypothetical protein